MGRSGSPKPESKTSRLLQPQFVASNKRKMAQKVMITVQMKANGIKQKNEGPPSDSWSWRKYGQKPIKGSPYPRGYYKCSSSKGCSAKKQVERSSTDASLFIITYTSTHNHPGPNLPSSNSDNEEEEEEEPNKDSSVTQDSSAITLQQEQEPTTNQHVSPEDINDDLHYCCKSPLHLETMSYSDLPLSYPQLMNFPKSDLSEEYDFYDELGELQLPPSSTSFAGIFEETILVDPS